MDDLSLDVVLFNGIITTLMFMTLRFRLLELKMEESHVSVLMKKLKNWSIKILSKLI